MTTLVTSEIRKVLTLRFWWALALPPLFAAVFAGSIYGTIDGSFSSELHDDAILIALVISILWVALFAGVFGAVNGGAEFRHATLTPTFLTARGRDGVLGSKLGVTAVVGLGYAFAVELVALGSMLAFGNDRFVIDSTAVGMLVAGLWVTVLWALIGAGLGLLFGSSTAAAITLVAWVPVGELITGGILSAIGLESLRQWLPGALTIATIMAPTGEAEVGSPVGAAVIALLVWTAVIAGLGWWLTRRRDIV